MSFITVDDGSLYFTEAGIGIPIIVLHGGPGLLDQGYLQPQLLKLAKSHRVIFYDQRGSGKSLSTPLDEQHINLHKFVEDLERLRASLQIQKCILLGHSWGGIVAMQYAIDYPNHLHALILLNPAPANYQGQKAAFIDEYGVRTKDMQNEVQTLFSLEKLSKLNASQISDLYRKIFTAYVYDPKSVQDLTLNFNVASAQSGLKVMEEMSKTTWLKPEFDLFPKLKNLDVPTFILHGKQDLVPAWTAVEIKNAIPNAEIVIFDKCGHFPYIEQPSPFFSVLNKFLNQIK